MELSVVEDKVNCELHNSLRYSMLLCRVMGLFPVSGLFNTTAEKLKFSYKSFYSIYYLMSVIGQFIMCAMGFYYFFDNELSLTNTANSLFNWIAFISTLSFLKLATEWAKMVFEVAAIERTLPVQFNPKVSKRCNIIAFVIMTLALVEHLLSVLFALIFVGHCHETDSLTKRYYEYAMPAIFDYTDYTTWKAVFVEITQLQSTFLWTFIDVIIMLFSLYIKAYFDDLNTYIRKNKKKATTSWSVIREHYSCLVKMVKIIDSRLNCTILLSFFSNLFYICLQLFNALNQGYTRNYACEQQTLDKALHGTEHTVYYTYSFLFLVIRAFMVSYMAANVNTAAHSPIYALCHVPPPAYSLEVQRFHRQVSHTTVALSGLNFFYVTRSMMLKVVGTIVTYELVLFQFSHGQNVSPAMDRGNNTAIY